MLKRLLVIGGSLLGAALIAGAIVLMSYEEHRSSIEYQRECQEHSASIGTTSPKQKAPSAEECQDPKDYMPWWYVLVAWPEGVTAWLLILTLGAIVWQAWETRKAAEATKDSANAAYGSVTFAQAQWELTKEKERARLDVKGGVLSVENIPVENTAEEYWHLKAIMRARNIGASRAFIIQSSSQFLVKPRDDETYPEPSAFNQLPFADSFLDPSDSFVDLVFTPLRFAELISGMPNPETPLHA